MSERHASHDWTPCDPDDNPFGYLCEICSICSCHVPSSKDPCPGEPTWPDDFVTAEVPDA